MQQKISPARSISGSITLPGDKSISHRYAMIASIAEGDSRIPPAPIAIPPSTPCVRSACQWKKTEPR
jgi:hypothetical protein